MKCSQILPPSVAGVLLAGAHLLPLPLEGDLAGIPQFCPLKALSGWPCPGCGITRSLVFSAHGDWTNAFSFHPLGPVFYGALWLALLLGVLPVRVKLRAISQRTMLIAGSTCVASLLIVWLVRMIGLFPFPKNF